MLNRPALVVEKGGMPRGVSVKQDTVDQLATVKVEITCQHLHFPKSYDLRSISKHHLSMRNGVLDSVHGIP
jgi:hypothetical protein